MGNTKAADELQSSFHQWCFNETVEIEHNKQTLEEERKQIEDEKRQLKRQQKEFSRKVEIEDRRLEQQQHLFDMKFKILEEELVKLASEKKHVEQQKAFYEHVKEYEAETERASYSGNVVKGELFFSGVGNKRSLKKRYRDLIKIYHPDNLDGDTDTLQEINREFEQLNQAMGD